MKVLKGMTVDDAINHARTLEPFTNERAGWTKDEEAVVLLAHEVLRLRQCVPSIQRRETV